MIPHLRPDTDPAMFVDWAEGMLRRGSADHPRLFRPRRLADAASAQRAGRAARRVFLGDDIAPSLSPWWSWWIRTTVGPPDWPRRLRELFEQADLLLVEGPFLRERVLELGAPPEKVHVQRIASPARP